MAKRFIDTNIWKKSFVRGLKGAYKLLWIYIITDCDHAGIWECDFEIAKLKLGERINKEDALRYFHGKITEIDNGEKWFIPSFIEFQYGALSSTNRAHNSVIPLLEKYNLIDENLLIKPLVSPLQGGKEKEKEKESNSKNKSFSVEQYIENNKEELTGIFNNNTILKKAALDWLAYKWKRKEYYTATNWAKEMVKRTNNTSVEFICSKIAETIAGESYQDYFYDSTLVQFKKLNGGLKTDQTLTKGDRTMGLSSELNKKYDDESRQQAGH